MLIKTDGATAIQIVARINICICTHTHTHDRTDNLSERYNTDKRKKDRMGRHDENGGVWRKGGGEERTNEST